MTYTEETGAHVTPERVRRGVEALEAQGFELRYERSLWSIKLSVKMRQFGRHLSDYSCNPPGPPRQT